MPVNIAEFCNVANPGNVYFAAKEKAFTANLDDGGIGGGPGGGGGGFLFWGLLMLLGFVRDNEQDQPYRGRKLNKQALANRAKRRPQLQA